MFNNFLLDGLDNNAYGESNQGFDNQIIAVPPDSVAQFQVVTDNESAEYGRSSGATINVASQSGTNRFHATVYEFIRNTALNAAGFFKPLTVSNTGSTVPFRKPTFNRNQYGFNVGGPILKDKLFFFLDYEGFRQVLKPLSVLTLPTQNELNGNLVVPVKNATTGVAFTSAALERTPPGSPRLALSTRFRHRSSPTSSRSQACPSQVCRPRVLQPTTTPSRSPSPTTPTKATFASTGRSIPRVPHLSASAIARRPASTIRPFPFHSTARPTAQFESSTSRSPFGYGLRIFGSNWCLGCPPRLLTAPRAKQIQPSPSAPLARLSTPGAPGFIPGLSKQLLQWPYGSAVHWHHWLHWLRLVARAPTRSGKIRPCWIRRSTSPGCGATTP